MPDDDDDDLVHLRDADPVDRASLPSADTPSARALFERIIMTEPKAHTPTATRTRSAALAVAAAAVLLVVGVVAVTGDDGDSTSDVASAPHDSTTTPTDLVTPGGSVGSCVEQYDTTTLTHREMAFEGTVASVDGDRITFSVTQWYRGGDSPEVTLRGGKILGGMTSAGPATSLEPGTRMLVAGDGGFAWSCGFTQPYDDAVAQQWREVLAA